MDKNKEIVIQPERTIISPEDLIAKAIDQNVAVETMERLLAMRERIKAEQAREAFNTAMAKFQGECPIIKKDKAVMNKDGRSVRYRYAPLEAIVSQCKEIIERNGFSYMAETLLTSAEGTIKTDKGEYITLLQDWVIARIKVTHKLGHSIETEFKVPVDKGAFMSEQQKFASALTYAKRYAFCNAFGILTGDEDNDANVIESDKPAPPPPKPPTKMPPERPPVKTIPDGEAPIDIMKEKIGGTGQFKDRLWKDAPEGYLKSLQGEQYWQNITPRKQDAIIKALAHIEAQKVLANDKSTVKQTDKPLFNDDGSVNEKADANSTEAKIKEKEDTIKLTVDEYDIPPHDKKREKDPIEPKMLEYVTWLLKTTTLFSEEEKQRIIGGTGTLNYNMGISQLAHLKKVYLERYARRYPK